MKNSVVQVLKQYKFVNIDSGKSLLPETEWKEIEEFKGKYAKIILYDDFDRSDNPRLEELKKKFQHLNEKDKFAIIRCNPQFCEFLDFVEIREFIEELNNPKVLFYLSFFLKKKIKKDEKNKLDEIIERVTPFLDTSMLQLRAGFLMSLSENQGRKLKTEYYLPKFRDCNWELGFLNRMGVSFYKYVKFYLKTFNKPDIFDHIAAGGWSVVESFYDSMTKDKEYKKEKQIFRNKNKYGFEKLGKVMQKYTDERESAKFPLFEGLVIPDDLIKEINFPDEFIKILPKHRQTGLEYIFPPNDIGIMEQLEIPEMYALTLHRSTFMMLYCIQRTKKFKKVNFVKSKYHTYDKYLMNAVEQLRLGFVSPSLELLHIVIELITTDPIARGLDFDKQNSFNGNANSEKRIVESIIEKMNFPVEVKYLSNFVLKDHPKALNARNVIAHRTIKDDAIIPYLDGTDRKMAVPYVEMCAVALIWLSAVLMYSLCVKYP